MKDILESIKRDLLDRYVAHENTSESIRSLTYLKRTEKLLDGFQKLDDRMRKLQTDIHSAFNEEETEAVSVGKNSAPAGFTERKKELVQMFQTLNIELKRKGRNCYTTPKRISLGVTYAIGKGSEAKPWCLKLRAEKYDAVVFLCESTVNGCGFPSIRPWKFPGIQEAMLNEAPRRFLEFSVFEEDGRYFMVRPSNSLTELETAEKIASDL